MQVKVLLFGYLSAKAQWAEKSISLPASATIDQLLDLLSNDEAVIKEARPRLAVAVNLEYQKPTHPLEEGDEVALIPPVSGG